MSIHIFLFAQHWTDNLKKGLAEPCTDPVTTSIYIIITTFTFVLLLFILSQILSILTTTIIIIITIIIIKKNTFLTFQVFYVMIKSSASMFQDLNQLSQLRRSENDQ